jgi:hypothetical protein
VVCPGAQSTLSMLDLVRRSRKDMHEGTSHQLNTNSFAGSVDHDSLLAGHRIDEAGKQNEFL